MRAICEILTRFLHLIACILRQLPTQPPSFCSPARPRVLPCQNRTLKTRGAYDNSTRCPPRVRCSKIHRRIKQHLRPTATTALLWFALGALAMPCRAFLLEYKGTLHSDSFLRGRVVFSTDMRFTADITQSSWKLRTEDRASPRNQKPKVLAYESYYDGSTIQQIEYWRQQPLLQAHGTNSTKYIRIQEQVHSQKLPLFTPNMLFPVWLGYASYSYFAAKPKLIPDITIMERPPDPAFACCQVRSAYRQIGSVSIPESITIRNIGKYESIRPGKPGRLVSFRPPYDHGFVSARYRVLKWMRHMGVESPAEALLEIFAPIPQNAVSNAAYPSPPLQTVMRVHFHTDNARILTNNVGALQPPSFKGTPILVQDTRTIVDGRPLKYLTTNGVLGLGTLKYQRTVKKMDAFQKRFSQGIQHDRHISGWVWTAFLPLLFIPLVLYLWEKRKPHGKKRSAAGE